ncbi:MAG: hypothetical protein V2I63_04445, partial [Pseudomonadales bacterium]|nr:hypothetical protein [Pseudomonadales bacterium]
MTRPDPGNVHRFSRRRTLAQCGGVLLCACLLYACASPLGAPSNPALLHAPELRTVPFYPQVAYQCGPAALATVLVHSGVDTTAEALVDQVWLPGRRGSLQIELVAATRRQGRLPYVLGGDLEELAAELRQGRPVLVLQNLGSSW